jgi:seryl-tRNA(Sec) selenium transferase
MDLKAKRKRQVTTTQPESPTPETNPETYTHSLSIQCNTLLYTTLQNWLNSAHTAQDFTYTSVADIIRAALEAYRNGLELTELDQNGSCKQTTIRVTQAQAEFYKKLPNQMRRKILERAIRTFIKSQ